MNLRVGNVAHGMKEFVMEAGYLGLVSRNRGGRRELTPDSCPSGLHRDAHIVTPHNTHTLTHHVPAYTKR